MRAAEAVPLTVTEAVAQNVTVGDNDTEAEAEKVPLLLAETVPVAWGEALGVAEVEWEPVRAAEAVPLTVTEAVGVAGAEGELNVLPALLRVAQAEEEGVRLVLLECVGEAVPLPLWALEADTFGEALALALLQGLGVAQWEAVGEPLALAQEDELGVPEPRALLLEQPLVVPLALATGDALGVPEPQEAVEEPQALALGDALGVPEPKALPLALPLAVPLAVPLEVPLALCGAEAEGGAVTVEGGEGEAVALPVSVGSADAEGRADRDRVGLAVPVDVAEDVADAVVVLEDAAQCVAMRQRSIRRKEGRAAACLWSSCGGGGCIAGAAKMRD